MEAWYKISLKKKNIRKKQNKPLKMENSTLSFLYNFCTVVLGVNEVT